MKLTKLFVAAAVLLAAVGAAFADEAKYNELLAKGKDYEAKKQWGYAMGTYWDAILEYPQGAKEAPITFHGTIRIHSKNNLIQQNYGNNIHVNFCKSRIQKFTEFEQINFRRISKK